MRIPINLSKLNPESAKIVYKENDEKSLHTKKWRDMKDDGVSVFWLGYVDAKNYLHKYKNAEELALNYIKSIKENFPLSEIILVEPHPQFVDNIFLSTEKLPVVEYKERKEQNDLLCEALNKYAKIFDINKVITQKEMLDFTQNSQNLLETGKRTLILACARNSLQVQLCQTT
jgi:hypothetical protein